MTTMMMTIMMMKNTKRNVSYAKLSCTHKRLFLPPPCCVEDEESEDDEDETIGETIVETVNEMERGGNYKHGTLCQSDLFV